MRANVAPPQDFNLEVALGGKEGIIISLNVRKTFLNRFRYWMLCKFFPFEIVRWDNEDSK